MKYNDDINRQNLKRKLKTKNNSINYNCFITPIIFSHTLDFNLNDFKK